MRASTASPCSDYIRCSAQECVYAKDAGSMLGRESASWALYEYILALLLRNLSPAHTSPPLNFIQLRGLFQCTGTLCTGSISYGYVRYILFRFS